jgi:hypothetical protein
MLMSNGIYSGVIGWFLREPYLAVKEGAGGSMAAGIG